MFCSYISMMMSSSMLCDGFFDMFNVFEVQPVNVQLGGIAALPVGDYSEIVLNVVSVFVAVTVFLFRDLFGENCNGLPFLIKLGKKVIELLSYRFTVNMLIGLTNCFGNRYSLQPEAPGLCVAILYGNFHNYPLVPMLSRTL